jgi:hypothetical protein
MAKKTGKTKGKGRGAQKRKARIADLDKDIILANKRAHVQSKTDDQLFVIDNKPGKSSVGGRAKQSSTTASSSSSASTSSSSVIPNVDVPLVFESAPTRTVLPGIARNLRNQNCSSKRVGGDRHLQGATLTKDEEMYDAWATDTTSSSSSEQSLVLNGQTIQNGWTEDFEPNRLDHTSHAAVYHNKRMASSKSRLTAADVAPEGASYNPEASAHAKLVLEAKAERTMRKQKLAHTIAALNPPVPPTDESLMDSDNEDDDAQSTMTTQEDSSIQRTAPKKLTTAQRNAQARVKAEQDAATAKRTKNP